jgi:hypothetical protein
MFPSLAKEHISNVAATTSLRTRQKRKLRSRGGPSSLPLVRLVGLTAFAHSTHNLSAKSRDPDNTSRRQARTTGTPPPKLLCFLTRRVIRTAHISPRAIPRFPPDSLLYPLSLAMADPVPAALRQADVNIWKCATRAAEFQRGAQIASAKPEQRNLRSIMAYWCMSCAESPRVRAGPDGRRSLLGCPANPGEEPAEHRR